MAEEFQGGVCGGTWWNPQHSLLSGGRARGLSKACLVAGLGGGCDDSLVFSPGMDLALEFSDNTQLGQQNNLFCKDEDDERNFDSIFAIESPTMMNTNLFGNSSQDLITITTHGSLTSSFPMSSSALYSTQPLLDDNIQKSDQLEQSLMSQLFDQNCGTITTNEFPSLCYWAKPTNNCTNMDDQYHTRTTLSNIQPDSLNSLQPGSRRLSLNKSDDAANEVNNEDSKGNHMKDQPPTKMPRMETPCTMPIFKVRKEKLGDRITALQQLVSPFGKTDTASVLHEAIEYIKFLYDQVNVLSAPFLKNGPIIQHEQDFDLRNQGLCLVPMPSTYPIVQESLVDFWAPTFEGTPFR